MLLPITLGQATWHYHLYLLHIWGFAREKKSLWYLFRKDIELSQSCVGKFCSIFAATQCRNLDMKWNRWKTPNFPSRAVSIFQKLLAIEYICSGTWNEATVPCQSCSGYLGWRRYLLVNGFQVFCYVLWIIECVVTLYTWSFIYFFAFVVSWYHIRPFPRLKGPYYTNNIDFISESACQRRVDTAVNFVDFWVLERSAVVIQKLCEVDEFYAM